MKSSEFIMAKALEYDNFELTKIAHELYGTDKDIDFLTKEAANPLFTGLLSAGRKLLQNNVTRNALIGSGVGAVMGGSNAEQGNKIKSTLKGALLGGTIGGVGTYASNVNKLMKPAMGPGLGLKQAMKIEGTNVLNSVKDFSSQLKPLMFK